MPRRDGGLGIRKCSEVNLALLGKLHWKFVDNLPVFGSRPLRRSLTLTRDTGNLEKPGDLYVSDQCSKKVWEYLRIKTGNDRRASFWMDNWATKVPRRFLYPTSSACVLDLVA